MGGHMQTTIGENIKAVRRQIADAAARAGRDPSGIKLVAVSKTKPAEDIYEAYGAGQVAFGENYAQEMNAKIESDLLSGLADIEWHMIGHIQTNKVKSLIGKTALIHSLDSIRLAEEIQKQAQKASVTVDVLLEINIARESSKYGFFIEETEEAAQAISAYRNIRVLGLMASAPYTDNPEDNRTHFKQLNEFFLDIRHKKMDNTRMSILSMGMSGDFEVAVEEGSTMLRIGTRLFGSR
ncbi:MAG: YggS family pyridoxal phosphate-dependent enzyme [Oscillospiraceae bacterium]|nr:YggS family pyridoxal phosphate-dependent enzyme [Oscillospiraceae bacterium]